MPTRKNGFRLFGVIGIADLFVFAAAVVLALGALHFSAPKEAVARPNDVTIRYTVELARKPVGFFAQAENGATVYDSVKGYQIGTVVDAYAIPARGEAPDEAAGIFRYAPFDDLEFTYIVIEAAAQITDTATAIGQYELHVNKEALIKSKYFAGRGAVTSITIVD